MATIALPDVTADGETEERARFWGLRPPVGAAVAAYSTAIDTTSLLSVGESEAARMRIAHVNECVICRTARAEGAEELGLSEEWYAGVADPARRDTYTAREALAIDFAERFCLGKGAFDEAFWARLQEAFTAAEIVDLGALCGKCLGLGRISAVFDLATTCALTVPSRA